MQFNEFYNLIKSIHGDLGVPEDYQNEYGLTLHYEEIDLNEIQNDIYGRPQRAARIIAEPWFRMKTQAEKEGIQMN